MMLYTLAMLYVVYQCCSVFVLRMKDCLSKDKQRDNNNAGPTECEATSSLPQEKPV